jgi:SHS family lactate transporter-like MFS transporter
VRARAVGVVYHGGALVAAFVPPAVTSLAARLGWGLATAIAVVAGGLELALAIAFLLSRRAAPAAAPAPAH